MNMACYRHAVKEQSTLASWCRPSTSRKPRGCSPRDTPPSGIKNAGGRWL